MAAVEAEDYKVVLYKSEDLKTWEHLSDFGPANATGGIWECPDLFALAGGRQSTGAEMGSDGESEPRRPERRFSRAILHRRLRRRQIHLRLHHHQRGAGPRPPSGVQLAGLGTGLLRRRLLQRRPRRQADHDRLDEQLGLCQSDPDFTLAEPHVSAPGTLPGHSWRPHQISPERRRGSRMQRSGAGCSVRPHPSGRETRPIPSATGTVQFIEADFTAGTAEEFGLIVRGSGTERTRIGINPAPGRLILDRTASGTRASMMDSLPSTPRQSTPRTAYTGEDLRRPLLR